MTSGATIHAARLEKIDRRGRSLLSVGELCGFAALWLLFASIATWAPDYSSNQAFSARLDIPPSAIELFPDEKARSLFSSQALAPASQVANALDVFHLLFFLTALSCYLRRRWRMLTLSLIALCIPGGVFGVARGDMGPALAGIVLVVAAFSAFKRRDWRTAGAAAAMLVLLATAPSLTPKPGVQNDPPTADEELAYVVAQQAYLKNDPAGVAVAVHAIADPPARNAGMLRLPILRKYAAANGALGEGEKERLAQRVSRARAVSAVLGFAAALFIALSALLEGFSGIICQRMKRLADTARWGGEPKLGLY